MPKGIIKWYDTEKNYGFITPDDKGEKDLFFHKTSIKTLDQSVDKGQRVEYTEQKTERGPQATDVVILDEKS